jgi:hypothetical protein
MPQNQVSQTLTFEPDQIDILYQFTPSYSGSGRKWFIAQYKGAVPTARLFLTYPRPDEDIESVFLKAYMASEQLKAIGVPHPHLIGTSKQLGCLAHEFVEGDTIARLWPEAKLEERSRIIEKIATLLLQFSTVEPNHGSGNFLQHGDFNATNIIARKNNPSDLFIVDNESVGYLQRYRDLSSILLDPQLCMVENEIRLFINYIRPLLANRRELKLVVRMLEAEASRKYLVLKELSVLRKNVIFSDLATKISSQLVQSKNILLQHEI